MPGPGSPTSLLLIDDDELSRAVLELHLTEAGCHVIEAESGEQALELLREPATATIQLILSDLQMPGISGPPLARELRSLAARSTPILAMSGSEPAPERLAGFDGFLLKPFTPDQLANKVEQLAVGPRGATDDPPVDAGDGAARHAPTSRQAKAAGGSDAANPPEVLDLETFDQLSSMLRPSQLAELFALSFSELDRHLALLRQAHDARDDAGFRHSAHTIKGAAAIVGARELQALGAALESGGGSPADQAATLREIPEAANRLKGMLTSRGVQLA